MINKTNKDFDITTAEKEIEEARKSGELIVCKLVNDASLIKQLEALVHLNAATARAQQQAISN